MGVFQGICAIDVVLPIFTDMCQMIGRRWIVQMVGHAGRNIRQTGFTSRSSSDFMLTRDKATFKGDRLPVVGFLIWHKERKTFHPCAIPFLQRAQRGSSFGYHANSFAQTIVVIVCHWCVAVVPFFEVGH